MGCVVRRGAWILVGRPFSPAVVYLLLGLAVAFILDAADVSLFDPLTDPEIVEHATEVAVSVALFSAGLKLDRRFGQRRWRSTLLLLGVVMPITIGAVALFGVYAMGRSLGAAVLLGAVLAPTDPVLAGEVQVGPPGEGDEPEPRFALTLTSEAGPQRRARVPIRVPRDLHRRRRGDLLAAGMADGRRRLREPNNGVTRLGRSTTGHQRREEAARRTGAAGTPGRPSPMFES